MVIVWVISSSYYYYRLLRHAGSTHIHTQDIKTIKHKKYKYSQQNMKSYRKSSGLFSNTACFIVLSLSRL